MSCFSLQREELASMIPYKLSKINKWKLFRRKKRYARNAPRHRNYALVYLDELYAQPNNPVQLAVVHNKQVEMPKALIRVPEEGVTGKTERLDNSVVVGTGSESVTGTREADEVDDVDLRAEIFIRKFKEDMRKQREVIKE